YIPVTSNLENWHEQRSNVGPLASGAGFLGRAAHRRPDAGQLPRRITPLGATAGPTSLHVLRGRSAFDLDAEGSSDIDARYPHGGRRDHRLGSRSAALDPVRSIGGARPHGTGVDTQLRGAHGLGGTHDAVQGQ